MTNKMPKTGPHRADADAERARQADRRLHHRQGRRRALPDLGLVGRRRTITCAGSSSICRTTARFASRRYGMDAGRPVDRRAEGARACWQKLTDEDVSAEGVPLHGPSARWTSAACPAMVNRVTYTGDLGYEIWVEPAYQRRLYQAIMEAGEELGIVDFGMRALLSMRLEKNFPTWFRELRPIYGPFEGGARPLRRSGEERLHRPRGRGAGEGRTGGKLRRVTPRRRRRRRRRDGRRADLA